MTRRKRGSVTRKEFEEEIKRLDRDDYTIKRHATDNAIVVGFLITFAIVLAFGVLFFLPLHADVMELRSELYTFSEDECVGGREYLVIDSDYEICAMNKDTDTEALCWKAEFPIGWSEEQVKEFKAQFQWPDFIKHGEVGFRRQCTLYCHTAPDGSQYGCQTPQAIEAIGGEIV